MFASKPPTCTARTLDLSRKDSDIRYLRHLGNSDIAKKEAGIRYWPNAVKGETRHYDQQSAYTIALRYIEEQDGKTGVYHYGSHSYILGNFPQERVPGTNLVTHANAIDGSICWKVTIPQHDRASVLQRLDRMNINAYTLFRTEDTLVKTYGLRELRRMRNTT